MSVQRDGTSAAPRASLRDVDAYAPEKVACTVDLSDNTSRWGMSPAAEEALRDVAPSALTRYPSAYAAELTAALARYAGVDDGMIVTGCGSDDVLDAAIRAFGEPGQRIAIPDPSFVMIPIFARLNGLHPVAVPLTSSLDVDPDAMLATRPGIVYLCSPNNPTGSVLSRQAIDRIVERAPGLVIIDEAYAEFSGVDCLDLVRANSHVLVTRTLSKAFGLAGLRVGYGVGSLNIVQQVEKSRGPYKVGSLAEQIACAALTGGLDWMRVHVAEAVANRARLMGALESRGLRPLPSAANFVFVPLANAVERARRMRAMSVSVRAFATLPLVTDSLRESGGGALRISVGPWAMIETALAAFDATAGDA